MAFLISQYLKNLPAIQEIKEMWVLSLSQKGPLAAETATVPVFLPEKWMEEPGGLQSKGSERVRHNRVSKHMAQPIW